MRVVGFWKGRNRPSVDHFVGAADHREGMGTDRRHVFVERRSPIGECRMDIRTHRDNPLRKFSNQMGEKRRRVFRRRFSDLRKKVFRNLFDGEEHRKARAENVVADGMTIDAAKDYLREHWPNIRAQLLEGTYQPSEGVEQVEPSVEAERGGCR